MRPPQPPVTIQDVGNECLALRARMAARGISRLYDEALRPVQLKTTQFTLLIAICHDAELPIGELAERLAMERTTLTRNLQLLEREGLVELRPGQEPRTKVPFATRKGRQRLEKALPLWQQAQQKVIAHLGPQQWPNCKTLLEQLALTPR